MSNSKECKFKVGDVVKLVDIGGLYSSENIYERERLKLNKDYTVCSVEDNGGFIKLIKDSGEVEGVFSYRLIHAEPTTTAESLRNSILSLQQERVSLQEKIEKNIAQEKSLTERLKELGFLLVESKQQTIGVVDEKKSVLYAEDIEEDMGDSRNWKSGDVLEVIKNNSNLGYWVGTKAKVVKTLENYIEFQFEDEYNVRHQELNSPGADFMKEYFKFHSRPITN